METPFRLHYDPFGRFVLTMPDGLTHVGVEAVRSFPATDPNRFVSIVDAEGREVAWVDDLASLPADLRRTLEAELTRRHFLPSIERILQVKGQIQPTEWDVETDHGPVRFTLNSDEDVRRMPNGWIVIADAQGVRYAVRNLDALDPASRRWLDNYIW
ncbi:MAG: DUF1854 domain-containing protein [Gemmataceae bacterium]